MFYKCHWFGRTFSNFLFQRNFTFLSRCHHIDKIKYCHRKKNVSNNFQKG